MQTDEEALTERVSMAMSTGLISRIDDWRRSQPRIPSRAEAARMLIEQSLRIPPQSKQDSQSR